LEGSGPCRIGVVGAFDSEAFGDALVPRVLGHELGTRVPGVEICTFAGDGSRRPTHYDGGEATETLGPWSPERAARIASGLDCIVVVGSAQKAVGRARPGGWTIESFDGIATCPVVRLDADAVVLAPRLFSPDLLAKRLEYLWLMRWYPPEGATIVAEGDASLLPAVPALGKALTSFLAGQPDFKVVLAEMRSPGDTAFADAIAAELPATSVYRLPRCAGLEDIAAALAHCAVFAGISERSGLVALAYGHPRLILDRNDPPSAVTLEVALQHGRATEGTHLANLADAELDAIADIVRNAAAARATAGMGELSLAVNERSTGTEEALRRLEIAHQARSRRLATERMVFANHLHKAEADIAALKAEVARLRESLSDTESRLAGAEAATQAEAAARTNVEAELAALRATRTFRYTAELRTMYGRLRQMIDGQEAGGG